MLPEIEKLKERNVPDHVLNAIARFLETGDPSIPRLFPVFQPGWEARSAGYAILRQIAWGGHARELVRFFALMSEGSPPSNPGCHDYLSGILGPADDKSWPIDPAITTEIVELIESAPGNLDAFLVYHLDEHFGSHQWTLAADPGSKAPFTSPIANFILRHISPAIAAKPEVLTSQAGLFSVLALQNPEVTRAWCKGSATFVDYRVSSVWSVITQASSDYDDLCLACCEELAKTQPQNSFVILQHLNFARGGKHADRLAKAAEHPHAALYDDAVSYLLEKRNDEAIGILAKAFAAPDASQYISSFQGHGYHALFTLIPERWEAGGRELLVNAIAAVRGRDLTLLLKERLTALRPEHWPALREGVFENLQKLQSKDQVDVWKLVAESHPQAFLSDFETLLIGKSKLLREVAAGVLAVLWGETAFENALVLLENKKSEARMGGSILLEKLSSAAAIPALQAALEKETSTDVRTSLRKALSACGVKADETPSETPAVGLADLEASFAKQAAKLKLPASSWLKGDSLPPLFATDGIELSKPAIAFLLFKQSKHKGMDAAPDTKPLLPHIDRTKSAPFGLALVEGFLSSEQAAGDRWALTLGGLLGDNRIIPPLLSRIPDWCENARHKLAEYSAQAISLLPGNEPLMVLDTLANRYRSKFKNVGKACAAAFNAAAEARGITSDELGDLVVPDFGFDADGIRQFTWDGGGASAELGADFKLSWFDPETDKAWKNLPASAPAEVKDEVKTVTKLMREAVKGQTARLEMALVRQRRWPVTRWRELYENHPLLRSFASGLVWGIYDTSGSLLRIFRRYPNGLLANASGDLEELPESDTTIGMVHPLELDAALLEGWRAHLARFKVKQPFPQIERAVELLDPLHGNRREISLTNDKSIGAGTLRSRGEKRGWVRGSVVDAGGISSVYKPYPGAGFEVILPTHNYYVGIDPMESVQLGAAYFVKADSVVRGGYTYDEPGPGDPRVARFDQVPAVVWSEPIADLKAIVGA